MAPFKHNFGCCPRSRNTRNTADILCKSSQQRFPNEAGVPLFVHTLLPFSWRSRNNVESPSPELVISPRVWCRALPQQCLSPLSAVCWGKVCLARAVLSTGGLVMLCFQVDIISEVSLKLDAGQDKAQPASATLLPATAEQSLSCRHGQSAWVDPAALRGCTQRPAEEGVLSLPCFSVFPLSLLHEVSPGAWWVLG